MIRVPKVPAFIRPKAPAFIRPKPPVTKPHAFIQPKACVDCLYFFQGQCTAFASQEPVTGSVEFFDAITMRLDETKCGISAKWFTPKKHV